MAAPITKLKALPAREAKNHRAELREVGALVIATEKLKAALDPHGTTLAEVDLG